MAGGGPGKEGPDGAGGRYKSKAVAASPASKVPANSVATAGLIGTLSCLSHVHADLAFKEIA